MDVTIVVATRHESENVGPLMQRVTAAIDGGAEWEVVFVDDSDDNTPAVIEQLAAFGYPVRLIHRDPGERAGGLAGALLLGFAASDADVVAVMDADLQHPPELLPSLLAPVLAGEAEVSVASRYLAGGSGAGLGGPTRRIMSRASGEAVRSLFPRTAACTDPGGNFFAVRRSVIFGIDLRPLGFKMFAEVLVRGRWNRLVEVPYRFEQRTRGGSKLGLRVCLRFVRHMGRLWFETRGSGAPLPLPGPFVRPQRPSAIT